MGTQFNIVLYAPDSVRVRRAADAAFARIDTLNQHLSDYLVESELSRLSATAGSGRDVPVSDDLWTVLAAAQHLAARTGGAFDVTVGPLTRLWRWAMRRDRLPPDDDLVQARGAVGYRHLVLDSAARTARLVRPGMRLDLGGIAKGYAVDEAMAVLQAHGLPRALVDGGGDLRLGDPPPGLLGWRIALSTIRADGERTTEERFVARRAVATSGATYRYVEVDGVRYSHLLDPHTGRGMTDERLVTVIAPTGMQADALASALSILPPGDGLAFVDGLPGVAARVSQRAGAAYRQRQSPAFETFFVSRGEE
jgi:thiamine biosynthesis lipoprotein